jgi:hypothetical protein
MFSLTEPFLAAISSAAAIAFAFAASAALLTSSILVAHIFSSSCLI